MHTISIRFHNKLYNEPRIIISLSLFMHYPLLGIILIILLIEGSSLLLRMKIQSFEITYSFFHFITLLAIYQIKSDLTKGSVSVTANGVKTFKTLLEELYALVDLTKVDHKSVFSIGQFKAPLVRVQPNALWFTSCIITDQFAISTYIVAGTSHTYSCIGTTPTFKSDDSYVWPNGTKLELFY